MKSIMRKIAKEGNEIDYFILRAEWLEESVSITLIDNENAWTGKLEPEDIYVLCKSMNKDKKIYFSEVICALHDGHDFTFTIENESFIMKKIDTKTNFKIRFCTVPLSKTSLLSSLSFVVGELLDNEEINKCSIAKMTDELQLLKQERQDLVKKLQNFIDEKSSLETMLYSQFCEVLNTKKQKILSLESQLSKANSDQHISVHNPNVVIKHEHQVEEEEEERLSDLTPAIVTRNMQDDEIKSNEISISSEVHTEAITLEGNKLSNHYDSETDIDTDNECSDDERISPPDQKISLPSIDNPGSKKRILPKRGSNSNVQKEKRKCTMVESTTFENEVLEFNSQSLLDEY